MRMDSSIVEVGSTISQRLQYMKEACAIPVSYTHLDVYKRQILGAAAWRYARTANFPQLFAGTIVRFLALLLLGVALMQGITYLPQADVTVPAQGFSYSLPFDMLVHLALLTLLTLFVVHLPLWAIAVLAVVTSPFITWTYTPVSYTHLQARHRLR